jgi:tetratricopeptide (TPR) repeat protein
MIYSVCVCFITFALLLSGCASVRDDHKPFTPEGSAQPSPDTQPQKPRKVSPQPAITQKAAPIAPQPAPAPSSTTSRIGAVDYEKTLDDYAVAYRKRPRDQVLTAEYAKSINDMRSNADKACEKKDYASAGHTYDSLLKHYDQFRGLSRMLSFNRDYLSQKLYLCKKSLSVRGFQEYRKGNLNEAIVLWQGLLSLDPNNKDIRKAMTTAREQQANLQKTN